MVSEILAWLAGTLAEARGAGRISFDGDPADQALLVVATLQGGLQIARTLGRNRFVAIARQLRSSLGLPVV